MKRKSSEDKTKLKENKKEQVLDTTENEGEQKTETIEEKHEDFEKRRRGYYHSCLFTSFFYKCAISEQFKNFPWKNHS